MRYLWLLGCAAVVIAEFGLNCARAQTVDPNERANVLFVEATRLFKEAVNSDSDEGATSNFRNGLANLDTIITKYPASGVAVQLASRQQIGDFSPTQILRTSVRTGSMQPTMGVGQALVVLKYPAGSEPQIGHVVAYRLPRDASMLYVHRLIGLAGNRIQMINGLLHINDEPINRERIADHVETENGRTTRVKRWRETLPNGVTFDTLDLIDGGFLDNTPVFTVPSGHYFMMGDNRDNSTDSRVLSQVGYVPVQNIVGRAIRP
jgi:signal peptidase I